MPGWLEPLIGALIGGVSVYTAIRTDLAALTARMNNVEESAKNANNRIDQIFGNHK